jgi:predicted xylose isomerase-like sugar epimerase
MRAMLKQEEITAEKVRHIRALIKAAEECGIEVLIYVPTLLN